MGSTGQLGRVKGRVKIMDAKVMLALTKLHNWAVEGAEFPGGTEAALNAFHEVREGLEKAFNLGLEAALEACDIEHQSYDRDSHVSRDAVEECISRIRRLADQ